MWAGLLRWKIDIQSVFRFMTIRSPSRLIPRLISHSSLSSSSCYRYIQWNENDVIESFQLNACRSRSLYLPNTPYLLPFTVFFLLVCVHRLCCALVWCFFVIYHSYCLPFESVLRSMGHWTAHTHINSFYAGIACASVPISSIWSSKAHCKQFRFVIKITIIAAFTYIHNIDTHVCVMWWHAIFFHTIRLVFLFLWLFVLQRKQFKCLSFILIVPILFHHSNGTFFSLLLLVYLCSRWKPFFSTSHWKSVFLGPFPSILWIPSWFVLNYICHCLNSIRFERNDVVLFSPHWFSRVFSSFIGFRVNQNVITSNVQLIFFLSFLNSASRGWTYTAEKGETERKKSKLGSCEVYTTIWFMVYGGYLTMKIN